MTEHGDGLRHEVTQLRTEVDRLRSLSEDAWQLAKGADEDISVVLTLFGQQTKLLTALRETQVEHDQAIRRLGRAVGGLTLQVSGLDTMVTGLDTMVTGLDTKVTGLATKVTGLDTKVTSLATKVTGLDTKVTGLATKVTGLDTKVDALAEGQAEHGRLLTGHGALLAEILRRLPAPATGSDSTVPE